MPVETIHTYSYRCGNCRWLGPARETYGQAQQDALDHWNHDHPRQPGSTPHQADPRPRTEAAPSQPARPGIEAVYVPPEVL